MSITLFSIALPPQSRQFQNRTPTMNFSSSTFVRYFDTLQNTQILFFGEISYL